MDDPLAGIDIEGPIQLEIFVLTMREHIELTGPCGPEAWRVESTASEHPVDVVTRMVRDEVGEPVLVHSTSWRQGRDGVVLSFIVVVDAGEVAGMASVVVDRVELARSGAAEAPSAIGELQVLEHGIRHLSWLATDDEVVRSGLTDDWHAALAAYVPEPFRNL